MSFVIIIRGPLGVGKTTVAKKVAFLLSAQYFSIDAVVDSKKVTTVKSRDGFISEKTFMDANKIIGPKIKSLLKKKKIVVVDGNFYRKKALQDIVKRCGLKTFVINLYAPVSICIARDRKRKKSLGKDATKVVYDKVMKVKYGKYIDTKKLTVNETVDHVIYHVATKLERVGK